MSSSQEGEPSLSDYAFHLYMKRQQASVTHVSRKGDANYRQDATRWLLSCFCRALSMCQLMAENLAIFFGEACFTQIDRSVYVYWVLDIIGEMETVVKSQTTFLSAKILGQVLPPRPQRCFLLGAPFDRLLGRWFNKSRFNARRVLLANTILQMKRCCPTVCDSFVKNAMQSHAKRLCEPRIESTLPPEPWMILFRQTMDLIFHELPDPEPLFLHEPSPNGHFLTNRKLGGGQIEAKPYRASAIYELRHRLRTKSVKYSELDEPAIRSLRLLERGGCVDEDESHPENPSLHHWSNESNQTSELKQLPEDAFSIPMELKERVLGWFSGEHNMVKAEAVPIREPCKVRVITMGETIPYLFGRSVQRAFSACLGKHPSMHFTRHALDESGSDRIKKMIQCADQIYGVRQYTIVSADYKDATDRLSKEGSAYVAALMSTEFGDTKEEWKSLYSAIRTLLSRHEVHYDRKFFDEKLPPYLEDAEYLLPGYEAFNVFHKEIRGVEAPKKGWTRRYARGIQQDGQLMGSPVSFGILCLVNLAVIRCVLAMTGHPEAHKLVLVNGDDGIFIIPHSHRHLYQTWEWLTTSFGLALSAGKNYVVDACQKMPFLTFNSKMYTVAWDMDNHPTLTYVPYVHSSLYKGWTKLEERIPDKANAESGIGPRCRELLSGFSKADSVLLRGRFLKHWSWALQDPTIIHPSVCWFMPEAYGGLGIPYMEGDVVPERRLRDARLLRAMYQFPALSSSLGLEPFQLFDLTKSTIFGKTALNKARSHVEGHLFREVKLRLSRVPFNDWDPVSEEIKDLHLFKLPELLGLRDDKPKYERFSFNRLQKALSVLAQGETSEFIRRHVVHFEAMQVSDFWNQPYVVADTEIESKVHFGMFDSEVRLFGPNGLRASLKQIAHVTRLNLVQEALVEKGAGLNYLSRNPLFHRVASSAAQLGRGEGPIAFCPVTGQDVSKQSIGQSFILEAFEQSEPVE